MRKKLGGLNLQFHMFVYIQVDDDFTIPCWVFMHILVTGKTAYNISIHDLSLKWLSPCQFSRIWLGPQIEKETGGSWLNTNSMIFHIFLPPERILSRFSSETIHKAFRIMYSYWSSIINNSRSQGIQFRARVQKTPPQAVIRYSVGTIFTGA